MLEVKYDLKHVVIDLRKKAPDQKDPKADLLYFVDCLPVYTVVEIHAGEYSIHLITDLESKLGMNIFVNEIGPKHFRFMGIKLIDKC